jgi:copper(I)-binding protein
MKSIAILLASLGLVTATWAAGTPVIVVLQSRATPSIPGAPTTAVYLSLHNEGARADRLLGASSPFAARIEIHRTNMSAGVSSMRPVDGVDLPVGGQIEFGSGGLHLMLVGLVRPLLPGMALPLTLKFQSAGEVKVVVPVLAVK